MCIERPPFVHECLSKSDCGNGFSLGSLLGGSSDISMRTEMMKFLRNAILLCLNVFPRNYILEEAVLVAEECLSKSDCGNGFSLGSLLGGSSDISMRTEMMKFLRNAILLCLNVFPRNYILEEDMLVTEELFVTKMKTCEVATTPCQALAKRLLKSDRPDLLLCGVYAQREAASGNMKHARRVFDMALTSICGLHKELQYNAPMLYLWYAESEVANSSGSSRETEPSSRAMHILCYLGSGLPYIPYTSQPSSMQILRARQGFREKLKKIQSTWSHGVTDDQSAALVCSAALFEELTNGLPGAVEILEHMFSSVLFTCGSYLVSRFSLSLPSPSPFSASSSSSSSHPHSPSP
ncbi:unnamed protein product [Microthlaspi erraticum]|uniref:Uncharacterized protein n=1 Tax=Microthlaspi erraticum TaxID=1685480 RepID=A0A6D2ILC7_9BRAS|nr:unnamed protein product [Microthlaspi erraticum]